MFHKPRAKLCDVIFGTEKCQFHISPADIFKGVARLELWWKCAENLWFHFLNWGNIFSCTQGLSLTYQVLSAYPSMLYEEWEKRRQNTLCPPLSNYFWECPAEISTAIFLGHWKVETFWNSARERATKTPYLYLHRSKLHPIWLLVKTSSPAFSSHTGPAAA